MQTAKNDSEGKVKDLLILIPCCRGFRTLVETYKCVKFRQNAPGITFDVRLVMNTKSHLFRKLLQTSFNDNEILVTESNGRPGKAHNACLEAFYDLRGQYRHMMMIDGDDFVYPDCVRLVGEAIRRSKDAGAPLDALFVMRGDFIEAYDFSKQDRWYVANQCCIYSTPLEAHGTNMWLHPPKNFVPIQNPFAVAPRSLESVGTPARGLVYSRHIFDKLGFTPETGQFAFPETKTHPKFSSKLYCENAKLMDDLLCFTLLWYARAHKLLNVEVCNNMSLYCYNAFHLSSATGSMASEGKSAWAKEDAIRDLHWPIALIRSLESTWETSVKELKVLNLGEEKLSISQRNEIQMDKIAFLAMLTSNLIKGCMQSFILRAAGLRKNMDLEDVESFKILKHLHVYAPFLPSQIIVKE